MRYEYYSGLGRQRVKNRSEDHIFMVEHHKEISGNRWIREVGEPTGLMERLVSAGTRGWGIKKQKEREAPGCVIGRADVVPKRR